MPCVTTASGSMFRSGASDASRWFMFSCIIVDGAVASPSFGKGVGHSRGMKLGRSVTMPMCRREEIHSDESVCAEMLLRRD